MRKFVIFFSTKGFPLPAKSFSYLNTNSLPILSLSSSFSVFLLPIPCYRTFLRLFHFYRILSSIFSSSSLPNSSIHLVLSLQWIKSPVSEKRIKLLILLPLLIQTREEVDCFFFFFPRDFFEHYWFFWEKNQHCFFLKDFFYLYLS